MEACQHQVCRPAAHGDREPAGPHSVSIGVSKLRPWLPRARSQGFPREAGSARTAARRRAVVTSVAAPRRRRSAERCPRVSRAGSSCVTAPSGPGTGCGTGFVVAFSCKSRSVCPSCNGRHMAQTAAHLADHVILPVRPITHADLAALTERVRPPLPPTTYSPGSTVGFRQTGSARAAGGSPRGLEPTASSYSRRLSSWPDSPTSCRRRENTGIATTGCLPRITGCGKTPAPTTRHGSPGRNC